MQARNLKRQIIHLLSRHSHWSAVGVEAAFKEQNVYADRKDWRLFLNIFLTGLGASFMIAGIVFFFAFNWDHLHKFVKLGIIQLLIVCLAVWILLFKPRELTRNIVLSVMSCLVGVLFAVFGQIYQTGANAYDFFLGWTLFIALWAIISHFPPLWLIFLVLVHMTLSLYTEQVSDRWNYAGLINIQVVIDLLVLLLVEWLFKERLREVKTGWFVYLTGLYVTVILTAAIIYGIYSKTHRTEWMISIGLGILTYSAGIFHGFRTRNVFYLSATGFSLIVILTALLIKPFEDPVGIFFIAGLFLVLTTTFLIRQIMKLNKEWHAAAQ
jgi:uncharacterized membrane protein